MVDHRLRVRQLGRGRCVSLRPLLADAPNDDNQDDEPHHSSAYGGDNDEQLVVAWLVHSLVTAIIAGRVGIYGGVWIRRDSVIGVHQPGVTAACVVVIAALVGHERSGAVLGANAVAFHVRPVAAAAEARVLEHRRLLRCYHHSGAVGRAAHHDSGAHALGIVSGAARSKGLATAAALRAIPPVVPLAREGILRGGCWWEGERTLLVEVVATVRRVDVLIALGHARTPVRVVALCFATAPISAAVGADRRRGVGRIGGDQRRCSTADDCHAFHVGGAGLARFARGVTSIVEDAAAGHHGEKVRAGGNAAARGSFIDALNAVLRALVYGARLGVRARLPNLVRGCARFNTALEHRRKTSLTVVGEALLAIATGVDEVNTQFPLVLHQRGAGFAVARLHAPGVWRRGEHRPQCRGNVRRRWHRLCRGALASGGCGCRRWLGSRGGRGCCHHTLRRSVYTARVRVAGFLRNASAQARADRIRTFAASTRLHTTSTRHVATAVRSPHRGIIVRVVSHARGGAVTSWRRASDVDRRR